VKTIATPGFAVGDAIVLHLANRKLAMKVIAVVNPKLFPRKVAR
jgi:hypothetical protein